MSQEGVIVDVIHLNAYKAEAYSVEGDFHAINRLMFDVKQCLKLSQLNNPNTIITVDIWIRFASSHFKVTASTWWFGFVSSGSAPASRNELRAEITKTFITFLAPKERKKNYRTAKI